ncbi:MAG: hypothetical protein ACTSUE_21560 [Promethearchaeota archaeon]
MRDFLDYFGGGGGNRVFSPQDDDSEIVAMEKLFIKAKMVNQNGLASKLLFAMGINILVEEDYEDSYMKFKLARHYARRAKETRESGGLLGTMDKEDPRELESKANSGIALSCLNLGRFDEAMEYYESVINDFKDEGNLQVLGYFMIEFGTSLFFLGQVTKAIEVMRDCHSVFKECDDAPMIIEAVKRLASFLMESGDSAGALKAIDDALAICFPGEEEFGLFIVKFEFLLMNREFNRASDLIHEIREILEYSGPMGEGMLIDLEIQLYLAMNKKKKVRMLIKKFKRMDNFPEKSTLLKRILEYERLLDMD